LAESKHGRNKEEAYAKVLTQEGGIMDKVTPSKLTLAEQSEDSIAEEVKETVVEKPASDPASDASAETP
jgi:spermidine/putrescine-binding protein